MSLLSDEMDVSHERLVLLAEIRGAALALAKSEKAPTRAFMMLVDLIAAKTDPIFAASLTPNEDTAFRGLGRRAA